MQLSDVRPGLIPGTLVNSGTLSHELDLGGFTVFGLYATGLVNSTLSFMGSALSDADGGVYVDIDDELGAARTIGPTGTAIAVSADKITQIISAYRYVRLKSAAAQTNGLKFYIPAKP